MSNVWKTKADKANILWEDLKAARAIASFDVSSAIQYVCWALTATFCLVCLIRPAESQIQLAVHTSEAAWDDYFSTLMTLRITNLYGFPFISSSFDGTLKKKENKWKSSFVGCQGTFLLSFARRDWNESGLPCLRLAGYGNQAECDAMLSLCKSFKPPIISVHYFFEKSRFLVIFGSGLDL